MRFFKEFWSAAFLMHRVGFLLFLTLLHPVALTNVFVAAGFYVSAKRLLVVFTRRALNFSYFEKRL